MKTEKIKIIDVGHKNLRLEDAQSLLETTISPAAYEGNIKVLKVSRNKGKDKKTYDQLTKKDYIDHKLIINCTPLGTHTHTEAYPRGGAEQEKPKKQIRIVRIDKHTKKKHAQKMLNKKACSCFCFTKLAMLGGALMYK